MNEQDFMASFLSEMSDRELEAFSDAMCSGLYYDALFNNKNKKKGKKEKKHE